VTVFQDRLPNKATIDGVTLEYGRAGAGRPLAYLHGCDGVSMTDPFIAPLARTFDITAVSLPGFGDSELPENARRVGDVARFLERACTELGVRDAVLVRSSFGGWVAAEMALRPSGVFSHLVLAAPMGARFTSRPDEVEIRDIFTVETNDLPALFIADPKVAEAGFSGMRFAEMADDAALRFCRNRGP
jgi:pimeloyl-ACP methyl ester carboxylesterase